MIDKIANLMDGYNPDEPTFRAAFWKWWDNELTTFERDKFRYHPNDIASMFFYNQIYKKRMAR